MSWLFGSMNKYLKQLIAGQKSILEELRLIRFIQNNDGERLRRIEILLTPPVVPTPEPISVWRMVSEREDLEMLKTFITFEAELPAIPDVPENADVKTQKVTAEVGGVEVASQELDKSATTVTMEVEKGSSVTLRRWLIDDDGNEGDKVASETFVAKDDIKPSAPGDFGKITMKGEVTREVPDEPTPESRRRR